jgi:hypothetical protein
MFRDRGNFTLDLMITDAAKGSSRMVLSRHYSPSVAVAGKMGELYRTTRLFGLRQGNI